MPKKKNKNKDNPINNNNTNTNNNNASNTDDHNNTKDNDATNANKPTIPIPDYLRPKPIRTPSIREREESQRLELEALESIYGSDFKLIKAGSDSEPLHFQLNILPHPLEDRETMNNCVISLDVLMAPASKLPLLIVKNIKGLSDELIVQLQLLVNEKAEQLINKQQDGIIYDISTYIQEFLIEHNNSPMTTSFYDEMLNRQNKEQLELQEKLNLHHKQLNEQEEKARLELVKQIEAAKVKKQEILKQQTKQNQLLNVDNDTNNDDSSVNNSPAPNNQSHSPPLKPTATNTTATTAKLSPQKTKPQPQQPIPNHTKIEFKTESKKPETKTDNAKQPITNKNDKKQSDKSKPKTKQTDEIKTKPANVKQQSQDNKSKTKKLAKPESESDDDDCGFTFERQDSDNNNDSLSEEDISESESSSDNDNGSAVEGDSIGDEEMASMFSNTGLSTSFKLDSNQLLKQLDTKKTSPNTKIDIKKLPSAEPKVRSLSEGSNKSESNNSDKNHNNLEESYDEAVSDDEDDFSEEEDAGDEIELASSRAKISSNNAYNSSGISTSSSSQSAAVALASTNINTTTTTNTNTIATSTAAITPANSQTSSAARFSRYLSDFDELELLGKGGFGSVFKCRNKVDKLIYAIKKIKLKRKNPAMNKKIIREVSTIAMLHHRYIVRYYQAWIEEEIIQNNNNSGSNNSGKPKLTRTHSQVISETGEDEDDWLSSRGITGQAHNEDDEDEDEEENSDESDESEDFIDESGDNKSNELPKGKPNLNNKNSSNSSNSVQQYLYIQMEYCAGKTLRDVINERVCEKNPEACWRLFRQLVEAVGYGHKRNIIHRDLKPANVFLAKSEKGAEDTVRLGDWGLATLTASKSKTSAINKANDNKTSNDTNDNINLESDSMAAIDENSAISVQDRVTGQVGTAMYMAPEQCVEGGVYDSKADMYALGIIFFELWKPFSLLMERALVLGELRKTGKVAKDFMVGKQYEDDRKDVIKIIEWLLKHDPEERPSAVELLKSGLIPLKIEDEYMELALKSISTRDSPYNARLLDVLFSTEPDPHVDFTFDYLSSTSTRTTTEQQLKDAPLYIKQLIQNRIFETVQFIFRLHSAALLSTPVITPKTTKIQHKANTAVFLDPSGLLVKLPYTLTVPFARFVAQSSSNFYNSNPNLSGGNHSILDNKWFGNILLTSHSEQSSSHSSSYNGLSLDLRRYDIAKVYRKNLIGGRPKDLFECDFDIVFANPFANHAYNIDANNNNSLASVRANYLASKQLSNNSSESQALKELRLMLKEKSAAITAEVLRVVVDVLSEFAAIVGPFHLRINHLDLLDCIIEKILTLPQTTTTTNANNNTKSPHLNPAGNTNASNIPSLSLTATATTNTTTTKPVVNTAKPVTVQPVKTQPTQPPKKLNLESIKRELLKLLGSHSLTSLTWAKSSIRKQLIKDSQLTQKQIDLLGQFFSIRAESNNIDSVLNKIKDVLLTTNPTTNNNAFTTKLTEAVESIRLIFGFLKLFDISDSIQFDCGLVGKYDLYCGGIVFQAFVQTKHVNNNNDNNSTNNNVNNSPDLSSVKSSHNNKENVTSNTYEVIALGGCYDSLISSFTPPNSDIQLSGIGVNFAIEKIVNSAVAIQMKYHRPVPIQSNTNANRRIRRGLLSSSNHSVNASQSVLLYCNRGHLLRERAEMASKLWNDLFRIDYLYPVELSPNQLNEYCRQMQIRWIVIFRRRIFKESGLVTLTDLQALASKGKENKLAQSFKNIAQDKINITNSEESTQILLTELPSVLRSKLSSVKRGETENIQTNVNIQRDNREIIGPNTSLSHIHIHLIDPYNSKTSNKTSILSTAKRILAPLLANISSSSNYLICAVDLPIVIIRSFISACYSTNTHQSTQQLIDDSQPKYKQHLQELLDYLKKKSTIFAASLLNSSNNLSQSSTHHHHHSVSGNINAAVSVLSHANQDQHNNEKDASGAKFIYIYSIIDKRADLVHFGSN